MICRRIKVMILVLTLSGCGSDNTRDSGSGLSSGSGSNSESAGGMANGEECDSNWECQSGNCLTSVEGTNYCYGDAQIGAECSITQDCANGYCRDGVCVEPGGCQTDGECPVNAICEAGSCIQVCGENAYATEQSGCRCLPGFEWASSDPSDTDCTPSSSQLGCHIYAQDSTSTYLGEVAGCYTLNSVCNQYGSFGSAYAVNSIFNEYGLFGSPYGLYSAFNEYAVSPPLMVCDGVKSGCVTINTYANCDSRPNTDPRFLCNCP